MWAHARNVMNSFTSGVSSKYPPSVLHVKQSTSISNLGLTTPRGPLLSCCLIVRVFIQLNKCILRVLLRSLECSFIHGGLTSSQVLGQPHNFVCFPIANWTSIWNFGPQIAILDTNILHHFATFGTPWMSDGFSEVSTNSIFFHQSRDFFSSSSYTMDRISKFVFVVQKSQLWWKKNQICRYLTESIRHSGSPERNKMMQNVSVQYCHLVTNVPNRNQKIWVFCWRLKNDW